MKIYPSTKIFRHRKENLKKCSLRGLENREDMQFFSYPLRFIPNLEGYVVLALEADPLSIEDEDKGLLLLDATWRYAEKMLSLVKKTPDLAYRSLPSGLRTAYPRKQTVCPDPERGLASIEALYAAYRILGRDTEGLLDHYFWKEEFLNLNSF